MRLNGKKILARLKEKELASEAVIIVVREKESARIAKAIKTQISRFVVMGKISSAVKQGRKAC